TFSGATAVAVTGAAGYLGSHVVRELLGRGLSVRAMVRGSADQERYAHLRELGEGTDRLKLVAADLLQADSLAALCDGADAVCHLAAAVRFWAKEPERSIVEPAVRGTKHVLDAASRAGVRTVVMASSVSAVLSYRRPSGTVFTEADWCDDASLEVNPYALGKTLSEQVAVEHHKSRPDAERYRLVRLNPAYVLGPILAEAHVRSSPSIVRDMLNNTFHGCPRLAFTVVDVRDVARAFLASLERPEVEGRFIVAGRSLWWSDIVDVLAAAFPERKFAKRRLPDWLVAAAGLVDPRVNVGFLRKNLGCRYEYDSTRAERELGFSSLPAEQTIADTARSMIERRVPGTGPA
ncbi:MAG TPA: NAD-dependent epimerase/dehydratase family protein, partial [Polyangiaceae bacterium]